MSLGDIAKMLDRVYKEYIPEDDERAKVLSEMTPQQRMHILARLEEKRSYWDQGYTPEEYAWAEEAIRAFKKRDYRRGLIYRYVKAKDIAEALKL